MRSDDGELGAQLAVGSLEPLPGDPHQQRPGSVKDETNGDDMAEDFSDFGDSDEDILNQEDEKAESRPVSRISGKSSHSGGIKEEGGGEAKKEAEEESDASKVPTEFPVLR